MVREDEEKTAEEEVEEPVDNEGNELNDNKTNSELQEAEQGETEDKEPDPAEYLKDQAKRRKPADIKSIQDDFYYEYESMAFKPVVSKESKQSPDLVKLL